MTRWSHRPQRGHRSTPRRSRQSSCCRVWRPSEWPSQVRRRSTPAAARWMLLRFCFRHRNNLGFNAFRSYVRYRGDTHRIRRGALRRCRQRVNTLRGDPLRRRTVDRPGRGLPERVQRRFIRRLRTAGDDRIGSCQRGDRRGSGSEQPRERVQHEIEDRSWLANPGPAGQWPGRPPGCRWPPAPPGRHSVAQTRPEVSRSTHPADSPPAQQETSTARHEPRTGFGSPRSTAPQNRTPGCPPSRQRNRL